MWSLSATPAAGTRGSTRRALLASTAQQWAVELVRFGCIAMTALERPLPKLQPGTL